MAARTVAAGSLAQCVADPRADADARARWFWLTRAAGVRIRRPRRRRPDAEPARAARDARRGSADSGTAKFVPGPPKRFAQLIGASLSDAALVAGSLGFGWDGAALLLVAMILVAAILESVFGVLPRLRHVRGFSCAPGVIPRKICAGVRGRVGAAVPRQGFRHTDRVIEAGRSPERIEAAEAPPVAPRERPGLELLAVLGVSLGMSGIYALLQPRPGRAHRRRRDRRRRPRRSSADRRPAIPSSTCSTTWRTCSRHRAAAARARPARALARRARLRHRARPAPARASCSAGRGLLRAHRHPGSRPGLSRAPAGVNASLEGRQTSPTSGTACRTCCCRRSRTASPRRSSSSATC